MKRLSISQILPFHTRIKTAFQGCGLWVVTMVTITACSINNDTLDNTSVVKADNDATSRVIDITNTILTERSRNCGDYVNSYQAEALNVADNAVYIGLLKIELDNEVCVFTSNAIPNHNFNDAGGFPNDVREQEQFFTITTAPQINERTTALRLDVDNAIMLNGVKLDVLAAGCFGVGDGFIGCVDMNTPWRYDPMFAGNNFGTDSHNAHTQPDGTYHYHGNPNALFDEQNNEIPSPVIGFAADGFPIFGIYFDDRGTIRKAISSYRLKEGNRPSGVGSPGGTYDGAFIDDYEYVEGLGDLDECNGMTIDGAYGYYVTDSYPHILNCFRGTPNNSFRKRRP